MLKYILIEKALFTAHAGLKNFSKDTSGKYMQDSLSTLRNPIKFKNDNKTYYVLSWDDSLTKPTGILPRYSENGNNEKVNKIMTVEQIRTFIDENIEPVKDFIK